MAFDAPRKTLDDIRRELDAEYGEQAANLAAENDRAAVEDSAPRDVPRDPEEEATIALLRERRPWGWGGYVIAGLVGCIAGQVLILAALAALHYSSGSAVRAAPPGASDAPAERVGPGTSVPSPPRVASETDDATPAPELVVVAPSATRFVPPANAPAVPAGEPRASVAAVTTPAPVTEEPKPTPRPPARSTLAARKAVGAPATPTSPAPAPSALARRSEPSIPLTPESQDWARSQDEVRVALKAWLARSHPNAADVRSSDTVVILGADGRTAKSHVRMQTAGGIVVHEQRWQRDAKGWSLIDNREAWR